MFLSMNNVIIYLTATVSNILALFYQKNCLMRSHVTRNALDDPRVVQCCAHNFIGFFGPNQKSLSLKMAEIWPIL